MPSRIACMTVMISVGFPFASAHAQEAWGTIKGRIVWGGDKIPERRPITAVNNHVDRDHCLKNGPVLDETWVVDSKTRGLRWTFVWLAGEDLKDSRLPIHPALKDIKEKEVVVDQPFCMYVPHVVGLRQGQKVRVKNSGAIHHNVMWQGDPAKDAVGNVNIAPKQSVLIEGLVASRIPVRLSCWCCPWMKGWVRVFDHPYFAVTDAVGKFEMINAPAGKYRLIVWHGSGGWLGGNKGKNGRMIEIKAGGVTDLGAIEYRSTD